MTLWIALILSPIFCPFFHVRSCIPHHLEACDEVSSWFSFLSTSIWVVVFKYNIWRSVLDLIICMHSMTYSCVLILGLRTTMRSTTVFISTGDHQNDVPKIALPGPDWENSAPYLHGYLLQLYPSTDLFFVMAHKTPCYLGYHNT